jgi:hypothetical protein
MSGYRQRPHSSGVDMDEAAASHLERTSGIEMVGPSNGFRSRTFPVSNKASLSLQSLLRSGASAGSAAARALGATPDAAAEAAAGVISVIVEAEEIEALAPVADAMEPSEALVEHAQGTWSARLSPRSVTALLANPAVTRIQSKKQS